MEASIRKLASASSHAYPLGLLDHPKPLSMLRVAADSRTHPLPGACAENTRRMMPQRFDEQFASCLAAAAKLAEQVGARGLLVLLDGPTDWVRLRASAPDELRVVVAADYPEQVAGAIEQGLGAVVLDAADTPVHDKLTQALLEAVADDFLEPGARVVAIYSGFEREELDSISIIDLKDHLGRLTVHDLRRLETTVPLDTLRTVVDLALEIGREGREGKPVGTLLVVGDTRKVLAQSHPTGFDPVRGYSRKERNLNDPRVREGIKEIAQMDGAIVVSPDGTVEAAARYIDVSAEGLSLVKGLGARHWAAAAVSHVTKAVAVAVSESSGTVRIFQNGEIVLRIEPLRRPMKWREFEYEPPQAE